MQRVTNDRKAINIDKLDADLRAVLGAKVVGVNADPRVIVIYLTDDAQAADLTTAQGIFDAHNPNLLTAGQEISAARTASREQVQDYIRQQLTGASPDTAAIQAQIESVISASTRLQNALDNIATLYGYDTGTTVGYLRAAILLVALMS